MNKLLLNRNQTQRLGFALLTVMAAITVLPIILVVFYVISQGGAAISWEFLSGFPRDGMRQGGILPALVGTLALTVGTAIFSVPLGVATLRDQFDDVKSDTARFALMSWFFEENLANFAPYAEEQAIERFQIIGTSGTVTTVAASHLGLKRYDRNRVDGLRMTSDQIDKVIREYLTLGPEGRRTDPRIGRDRHALIMSGAAILQALLRVWPTNRLSVADRGLREGLLYAQMSADGVLETGPY